jgi:DNA-binding transcriptional regulator GbsR (MarR family)
MMAMPLSSAARFIEQIGRLAEGEGLPRIAGRMLGVLMLETRGCSLDEVARQLRVSRASISTNGRLLHGMGLIQRVTLPGDRRDYWHVPDASRSLLQVGIRRMRVMQTAIREMREAASAPALTESRMSQIEELYEEVIARADRLLASWQVAGRRIKRRRAAPAPVGTAAIRPRQP